MQHIDPFEGNSDPLLSSLIGSPEPTCQDRLRHHGDVPGGNGVVPIDVRSLGYVSNLVPIALQGTAAKGYLSSMGYQSQHGLDESAFPSAIRSN